MAKNTMTGNRALLKLKGEVFAAGTVQDVSFSDDLGLQKIGGIGEAEAVELVTGEVGHTIELSRVFIYNKSLAAQGFIPSSDQYLDPPEMDVEILDKVSGETVEHYTGCKAASGSRAYTKNQPTIERLSMIALHKEV